MLSAVPLPTAMGSTACPSSSSQVDSGPAWGSLCLSEYPRVSPPCDTVMFIILNDYSRELSGFSRVVTRTGVGNIVSQVDQQIEAGQ